VGGTALWFPVFLANLRDQKNGTILGIPQ
jgi:hypothetical protein